LPVSVDREASLGKDTRQAKVKRNRTAGTLFAPNLFAFAGAAMTNVSFAVPTNYRVGSDPRAINQGRNPNDPNMITTGTYGSAFDLALQTATSSDGTTTDTLTYQSYNGDVRGSFSAVSDTGKGTDLASAYQSLLTSLKANGELSGEAASHLQDAYAKLDEKSQHGSTDTTVTSGAMIVQAGGPLHFNGISAYQNTVVDSIINNLFAEPKYDNIA